MTIPRITDAAYVSGFVLRLHFEDGTEGTVNLEAELYGPVFEPLKDPAYFRRFKIHPELHTLTWENGADFAPEFLYSQVRQQAA
jgi:hypothetical protein